MRKRMGKKIADRILAAVLSFVMVAGMLPANVVSAATSEHPDAVTITVIDEEEKKVEGAEVEYRIYSKTQSANIAQDSADTDPNGTVEVLNRDSYVAGDLTITATVRKAGYTVREIDHEIKSEDEDILVTIDDMGITVNAQTVPYDGKPHDAANVTGLEERDKVSYRLYKATETPGEDWADEMPQITELGEYTLDVKVDRDGYETFSTTVSPEVTKGKINATVQALDTEYDGQPHPAVQVTGLEEGDQVTYQLGDGQPTETVPEITNAGTYTVKVRIVRDENYEVFDENYTATISPAKVEGISVEPYSGTYDGESHKAVEITGLQKHDKVEYSLDNGAWTETVPEVTNAGQYAIEIRVTRYDENTGSPDGNYEVLELPPSTVTISKADQTLKYTVDHTEDIVTLESGTTTYNFSAVSETLENTTITYEVGNASQGDTVSVDEIAAIDDKGQLTLLKAGHNIKITATAAGNANYNDTSIEYYLAIQNTETDLISFEKEAVSYTLSDKAPTTQPVRRKYSDDNGTVTYSAKIKGSETDASNAGLTVDPATGTITVNDYESLTAAMETAGGTLDITVTAEKAEGTKKQTSDQQLEKPVYAKGTAQYTLTIEFAEAPSSSAYTLQDPDGNILTVPNGDDGWFNTAVTVVAPDGCQISKTARWGSFKSSVVFDDQGETERKIYLRSEDTNEISAPITVTELEKIDSVSPDSDRITIEYSEPVRSDDIENNKFHFYKDSVTITFTAYDDTSGIDHFNWTYKKSADAGNGIEDTLGGTVAVREVTQDPEGQTKYIGTLTLPEEQAEQLRGNISVSATDNAGLTSDFVTDDGNIIVVDSISPTRTVSYELADAEGTSRNIDGHYYYSGAVNATFTIDEANFFPEDVVIKVAKDGGAPQEVDVDWEDVTGTNEHQAAYTINAEDGDYVVAMDYKDRSDNRMETYISDVFTIDTKDPVITFKYNDYSAGEDPQTAIITVEDHNFQAEDIALIVNAVDIKGETVGTADLQAVLRDDTNWEHTGDVHTATLSEELADAIYQFTLDFTDMSGRKADQVVTDKFTVDRTAVNTEAMEITYSEPVTETILSAITFGFYNPSVDVTFTAKDETSGIEYFMWSYERENGASESNVEKYEEAKLPVVQDENDASIYTATVTLPKEEAEQLRGSVAFTATDYCDNVSQKVTDTDHVLVVDTVAPEMTASYNEASRTIGTTGYYNKDVEMTFTVTEANFYPEDVVVEISKDGGAYEAITPEWTDESADVHTGRYTLPALSNHSNDGDYKVRVNYIDRSNNAMATYVSDTITVDTIAPVIRVAYSNNNEINVLTDTEGHTRNYYDNTQTATVTVEEHNFVQDEVDFSIIAKDYAGNVLNADSLNMKTSWRTNGDTHSITISYPGDANYTFDVAYADLATNQAADYEEDYFTVDRTSPTGLSVSYSTSILETVLQGISFGFYDARMQVTLQAEDNISGIHGFDYSYVNAEGVSQVNAELLDQTISEAEITHSRDSGRATAVFSIPRSALGSGNQFNGSVRFITEDRSGNDTEHAESKRIVVDNIAPQMTVEYNTPVNTENGISYYDGAVNVTIRVNEANFYAEDMNVSVTRDGSSYSVSPNWSSSSTDAHTGTFTLTDDGDYFITINYSDKSGNAAAEYRSDQLTVDTEINAPVITVNGEEADGRAFKDEVIPAVSFEDINYDSYEIQLTRTRYDDKNADVTSTFIKDSVSVDGQGGSGSFDTFEKEEEVDGIYTMTVTMRDKAGHSAETTATFTVNRFGSVYEYGDYLILLIENGGAYVQNVERDLVITEYNADRLLENSLDIAVSKDGRPVTGVDFEVTPEINDQVSVGNSGWYQYRYTISKDNFADDGVYRISVSSKDATGNSPETTNFEDKDILFRVDSTAPEINSVTGLEKSIINAADVNVNYTVYDTIGLKSIQVYVDGEKVDEITDFTSDMNNYDGTFTVNERQSAQHVRLVAEDLAGNVTDTDSEEFESAYAFNRSVTISTNFFVRFYANKPLFWGTIIVVILAAGGITALILVKRRKKQESE